jgi:hypothetical protein
MTRKRPRRHSLGFAAMLYQPPRRARTALILSAPARLAASPRPMASPPAAVLCRASALIASPVSTRCAAARPQVVLRGYLAARVGPTPGRLKARARVASAAKRGRGEVAAEDESGSRALFQAALWGAEAAYILWLFLLPYAPVRTDHHYQIDAFAYRNVKIFTKYMSRTLAMSMQLLQGKYLYLTLIRITQGDPAWAISQATISDLSLNSFVLPLLNSGTHELMSILQGASIQVSVPALRACVTLLLVCCFAGQCSWRSPARKPRCFTL